MHSIRTYHTHMRCQHSLVSMKPVLQLAKGLVQPEDMQHAITLETRLFNTMQKIREDMSVSIMWCAGCLGCLGQG